MNEENWRRITTRFIDHEDLKNASISKTYAEAEKNNNRKEPVAVANAIVAMARKDTASEITCKKLISHTEAENCEEGSNENLVKSMEMENKNLGQRQPIRCVKSVQKPESFENNPGFISARDIKRLKKTLENMKNDLNCKEKIIQDKTETIDKLERERQMVAIAKEQSLMSKKEQQKIGLVLHQPQPGSANMNALSSNRDEEVGNRSVAQVHNQQHEILQAIMNRLDGLEKRIEEVIKSIPKEIQSSVETYLTSLKCNESQQSFSVCPISNSESKPKLWNKIPAIQPRSNLSSNMRLKLRNCNNVSEDLNKGPSLCLCQYANCTNVTNFDNCPCKSAIEMQISAMEKVVATLKFNFMKLFKKTTARGYLKGKTQ